MFKWLQNYRENQGSKRIEKSIRLASNKKAIKEERMGAINNLAASDNAQAVIPGLLKRFEFSDGNGIQDAREKERAMAGIVKFEKEAIKPVVDYLQNSNSIAWPLKILAKISDERVITEALKNCLHFEDVSFDLAMTDKNYDILCYLRDFKVPGYVEKLAHFLSSPDERVRYAAVECLVEQEHTKLQEILEPFLSDDSAENTRIRETVIRCFHTKGWKLTKVDMFLDGMVMPGVKVNKQGELKITEKRLLS